MEDEHCKTRGLKGLTALSKLIFLAIFLLVAFLVWELSAKGNIEQAKQTGEDVLISWITATGKMIIAGLLCAYAAHFFLPHTSFKGHEFYCADCGQLLGDNIIRCINPRCLSNRYTTDPSIAEKAKLLSADK